MGKTATRWILTTLIAIAILVGGFFWSYHIYKNPGPLSETTTILLPKGAGLVEISAKLKSAGIIDSQILFLSSAVATGRASRLKAGEYKFPTGISLNILLDRLARGDVVIHKITIPEGLTSRQIVALLDQHEALSGSVESAPAEGSLLPQTYHFSRGDDRAALIERMTEAMQREIEDLWAGRAATLPLKSLEEAVILASIVERETSIDAERPRVAAVFLNRLRLGMKLQSDPTVIYGISDKLGVLDRPLSRRDLQTPHPYNTYVIDGLPPAPIANPGLASLQAVLHPIASDELYFVADGTGGHVFAKTLAQHNKNVAAWRRKNRQ